MKFYNRQHKYYCGVNLHARKMVVCILDEKGKVVLHLNIKTDPERFFELIFPFIEDIIVGVECVFCWHPKGISFGHIGWPIYAPTIRSTLSLALHCT